MTSSRELDGIMGIDDLKRYASLDACNMTKLALALSGYVNRVTQRHAEMSALTNGGG